MSLFLNIKDLVDMTSIGTLIAYTLVTVSVLKLRYSKENIGLVAEVEKKGYEEIRKGLFRMYI